MQAHLIYNGKAGGGGSSVEELQAALRQAGFFPVYKETGSEDELDPILDNAEGLVVAAGGDGTVRAVITRLIGKDLPLAILPKGTANNIAKSLEVPFDPMGIIAGLENPRTYPFDVGYIKAPWGEDYFVEGAGFGFFADALATYQPDKGKSIWRGLEAFSEILLKGHAYGNRLRMNGEEISGDFLLVELLNTTAIGPRLRFSPDASPGDGLLDLVCIHASDREGFLDYLASLVLEDLDKLESVTRQQLHDISFTWNGFPVHVDGEVWPPVWLERQKIEETEFGPRPYIPQVEAGEIQIKVLPSAITLWLPPSEEELD